VAAWRAVKHKALVRLPVQAAAYQGLARTSLAFDGVAFGAGAAAINILIPSVGSGSTFAGVKTALLFAAGLARDLDRPLQVVTVDPKGADGRPSDVEQRLRRELSTERISLIRLGDGAACPASPTDFWIVTYWTTAHAADIACRLGVLDPARVVYLIQDYEPAFHPWSVAFALTRRTYHAGFRHVVNSTPLANYVASREGIKLSPNAVFAPHLDLGALQEAAGERKRATTIRLFFYARPSKPRNLYELGVAALLRLPDVMRDGDPTVEVVTAGERHPPIRLGDGIKVTGLGKLNWTAYCRLLANVDVGLTLMHSPHPSHPPLELAVSGALAVTNEFGDARHDLHPRLVCAEPDVDYLAEALGIAVRRAQELGPGEFEAVSGGRLGRDFSLVIGDTASALRAM
jgi:O-antigen biosynthesis protein